MFRRFLVVLVLALAALIGGGGVAYAADQTPVSTALCAKPPTPTPLDSISDKLDITAPETFGDGIYSRYGWTGFTRSTVYDPGCWERVAGWYAEKLVGAPGIAADALTENGPNRVIGWGLSSITFVTSIGPTVVRFAVGDSTLWRVLDVTESSLRLVTGAQILIACMSVSCALTGLWFLLRSRTDPLGVSMSRTLTAAGILTVGVIISLYQLSAAPSVDGAVQASYVAAGQVATGQTSPDGEKVDAGTMVADSLADGLLLKVWGVVHLGPDMQVVDEYAPRLFAAQAFTREEAAHASTDTDYRAGLVEAKNQDYRAVAAEIQASHPDSYAWLSDNSDQRGPWVLVGLLASILITVVIGGTAAVVAASRVAIRLLVGAFPGIAALTMIPPLQKFGRVALEWVVKLPFIAAAFTGALMVFIQAVLRMLDVDDEPWFTVLIALCIMCGLIIWVWSKREDIAKAAGVAEQKHAADAAMSAASDGSRRAADAGMDVGRRVHARAQKDWDRANDWRGREDEYEWFSEKRPAGPPVVKSSADRDVVAAKTATDMATRAENESAKAIPDPVTATSRKAKRPAVQHSAATFMTRPTEATLARREAVNLAVKSTRRMPVKATTATTQTAAKAASRATVTNAVKVMTPRTPTTAFTNAVVASARK